MPLNTKIMATTMVNFIAKFMENQIILLLIVDIGLIICIN